MIWIKRHLFAGLFVAVVLALAACGGAGGGGGGGGSEEARTVEHAMGETKIKGTPKRVVVLDTGELDSAMSLGMKPVGAVEAVEGLGLPSYLEGTGGIENVGTIEEPNLEKIATLDPDLILSSKLRHEQIYDQLSQIAPTVFTETTGVTWKENFAKHAEAMNRSDEAREVLADYDGRLERFEDAMGDRLGETEVSVVRFLPGETRIYQKESFIGTVLEDAGLPRPPSQDVDEFAILNVSEEEIPKMDGDAVFVTVYGAPEDSTEDRITSEPLWQRLEAVQQDRVYEVSDDLWMLGIGPTAAEGVVDDLEKNLAVSYAPPSTTHSGGRHRTGCAEKNADPHTPSGVHFLCTPEGDGVEQASVREVRENLRAYLERAEAGEEISILRRGKEVARLVPPEQKPGRFPDLTEFRASIKIRGESPLESLRKLREEAR